MVGFDAQCAGFCEVSLRRRREHDKSNAWNQQRICILFVARFESNALEAKQIGL